jgi:hypothetical protein
VTGVPATGTTNADGICVRDPAVPSTVVTRIPLDAPHCTNVMDNSLDSRCNPNLTTQICDQQNATKQASPDSSQTAIDLLAILKTSPSPNPCLYLGGPNEADATSPHTHALIQNTQLQFIMTNLDRAPTTTLSINFNVEGGFQPQFVVNPVTVEVSLPSRILVGPFLTPTYSVPYLFVVDQRRLGRSQGGGPTRGQILRINPLFAVTGGGLQPIYEDRTTSGNLFPSE